MKTISDSQIKNIYESVALPAANLPLFAVPVVALRELGLSWKETVDALSGKIPDIEFSNKVTVDLVTHRSVVR
jgi:hypothetical protein